jgi:NTE family protein
MHGIPRMNKPPLELAIESLRPPARAPTVSLVLGSGGARGLAHIGVIQWLTEHGYAIRSLAGASIGALVGGIHAAGQLSVYTEWVLALERMHVLRLLDPTIGRPGIFKGERVIQVLRELIGDCDIEALPMAFTAVATDLDSGQEVWLRQGKLFDAIRASMATPMVFTPVQDGDRYLIDGAVVNPVPVSPTQGDATDLTIAVNLDAPAEAQPLQPVRPARAADSAYRQRILKFVNAVRPARLRPAPQRGPLDVAFTAMQAMQDTIAQLKLSAHPPDVVIEIPRNACGFFEFWRAEELIALGRARTAAALAQTAGAVGVRRTPAR